MLMINLYVNKSDNNVVDKNITAIHSNVNYEFKTETSQTDPIIFIDRSLWNDSINYVYVEELKRFFFIKDVKFMTGKIIALECHVDVLTSFKESIKTCECILDRQERQANLYFNDNEFYALNKDTVSTLKFPHSFTKNGAMILVVMGGN